jgi:predicted metal-binding transcription factor (methanogenesis marker protein 9)
VTVLVDDVRVEHLRRMSSVHAALQCNAMGSEDQMRSMAERTRIMRCQVGGKDGLSLLVWQCAYSGPCSVACASGSSVDTTEFVPPKGFGT